MTARFGRSHLALAALSIAAAIWIAVADPLATAGRLSWMVYDAALVALRPEPRPDSRIVIVDIDDDALQAQGRWPWPRQQLAELIETIQQAGATQIGLDILLPEPGIPAGDAALARQLAADNVTLATAFGDPRPRQGAWPLAGRELPPTPALGSDLALGHITPHLDPDGRIRWLYPRLCSAEGCRDTLALAMLEQFTGLPPRLTPPGDGTGGEACVAGFCRRTDAQGRLLIPYQHAGRFAYLGADAVMRGEYTDTLDGALVLIGTSAAGLGDIVATPRGPLTPGVELHAILLASWLDGLHWRILPHVRYWQWGGLALMTLILGLALAQRPARSGHRTLLVVGTLLGLAIVPLACLARGVWLDPWPWWNSALGMAALWLFNDRWRLWQRHRQLYRAFGSYVPHSVLRQLAMGEGDPNHYDAQRRELTLLFTDIRGFTAISERLAPEQLTTLTSHLFSELTEVVHEHGGTLDKYIGDSLMAFWGAPLAHDDDPQRALACAHALLHRLEAVNDWSRERGLPAVRMNIGLETGEVTVGNLGSRQRRAYTALGSAVNVASRLEELAGRRGEPIIMGPGLMDRLGPERVRHLDRVHLRGIAQPLDVGIPAESAHAARDASAERSQFSDKT